MDTETRGRISEIISNTFEEQNISEQVKWALETNDVLESQEDFILGYVLGYLMNFSSIQMYLNKLSTELEEKERRKLIRKFGKRATEKFELQAKKVTQDYLAKTLMPLEIIITDEEYDEIRSMLIPMIKEFRTKIRQEQALKKSKK